MVYVWDSCAECVDDHDADDEVDRDRDPFVKVSVWESETVSVIVDVADRVGVGGGVMVEVIVSDVVMELDSE
jgi:hypothetical protein